ncbi:MAG: phosphatidate cytidylyltransferase [bacterium]|nr:phosphatidate cytidylyltransferase [bacterium]
MFKERLISGIILLIIMIGSVVLGGNVLFALVAAISLVGLMELYRVVDIHKTPLAVLGYAATLAFDFCLYFDKKEFLIYVIVVFMLCVMACYVLCYPKYNSSHVSMTVFSFIYAPVMLSYLYQLRIMNDGIYMIWLAFIGAWGSDTCAYVVGMLIGKHKLPSELSPKKSIEGCIGGIIGAGLIGFIYATIFKSHITLANPQVAFAIIGAVSSVLSQIGDLAASAIKRNHQIKDYGTLIPGHGGIMDRFDSIIFTAPIVFLLLQVL